MSFWEKIKLFSSEIFAFLLPFIKQFLTRAGRALLPIVGEVVREVALSYAYKDGTEKREIAFNKIQQAIKDRIPDLAEEIGESMINSAIEAAVRKLKE